MIPATTWRAVTFAATLVLAVTAGGCVRLPQRNVLVAPEREQPFTTTIVEHDLEPLPISGDVIQLEQVLVSDVGIRSVVTLKNADQITTVKAWLRSGAPETAHHGFPVVDDDGRVLGVVTQRDIYACRAVDRPVSALVTRSLIGIARSTSLREAADTMLREGVGRLPVMEGRRLLGIITRSDLLEAHQPRLIATTRVERTRRVGFAKREERRGT